MKRVKKTKTPPDQFEAPKQTLRCYRCESRTRDYKPVKLSGRIHFICQSCIDGLRQKERTQ